MERVLLANQSDGLTGRISSIIEAYVASRITRSSLLFAWPTIEIESNQEFSSVSDNPSHIFNPNLLADSLIESVDSIPKSSSGSSVIYFKYGQHFDYTNNDLKSHLATCELKNIFHTSIIEAFEAINSRLSRLEEYDSVHLRCGDVFYGDHRDSEGFTSSRSLDYTQVVNLCRNKLSSQRVFLFGATVSDIAYIKSLAQNVFTMDDVLDSSSGIESNLLVILDAYIASKSMRLYCAQNSHVSRLSYALNPSLVLERLSIFQSDYLDISRFYYDPAHTNRHHNTSIKFRRFLSHYKSGKSFRLATYEVAYAALLDSRYEGYRLYYILMLLCDPDKSIKEVLAQPLLEYFVESFLSNKEDGATLLVNSKISQAYLGWQSHQYQEILDCNTSSNLSRYLNHCLFRFLISTGPRNEVLLDLAKKLPCKHSSSLDISLHHDLIKIAEETRSRMNSSTLSILGISNNQFLADHGFRQALNIEQAIQILNS